MQQWQHSTILTYGSKSFSLKWWKNRWYKVAAVANGTDVIRSFVPLPKHATSQYFVKQLKSTKSAAVLLHHCNLCSDMSLALAVPYVGELKLYNNEQWDTGLTWDSYCIIILAHFKTQTFYMERQAYSISTTSTALTYTSVPGCKLIFFLSTYTQYTHPAMCTTLRKWLFTRLASYCLSLLETSATASDVVLDTQVETWCLVSCSRSWS